MIHSLVAIVILLNPLYNFLGLHFRQLRATERAHEVAFWNIRHQRWPGTAPLWLIWDERKFEFISSTSASRTGADKKKAFFALISLL